SWIRSDARRNPTRPPGVARNHAAGNRDGASRLKTAASHAVEDAVTEAKRFAKRGRYAAEDLMEDTAHRVKRDPLRSVGFGFAVGFSLGALAVWVANARGQ